MNICCLECFREINNKELVVNPWYHSKPDPRVIQYLADNYEPRLFNPIKVVFRDGKYYIIDGLHTREALVRVKGTDDFPILCRVFTDLSAEDEAQLYAMLHGSNRPSISYNDKIRALYHAKDTDAVRFVEVTRGNGFGVNMDNHHAKKGTISAVYTAFRIYMDLGEQRYGRMLQLIRAVWNGEPWSLTRNILRGMARFMRMYDFSDEEFIEAFRNVCKTDIDVGVTYFSTFSREGAFAKAFGYLFEEYLNSQREELA